MARPESTAVGGYFPTPEDVLPHIASVIRWPRDAPRGVLLDPCAGEGTAITALRDAWADHSRSPYDHPRILACELEAERATTLRSALLSVVGDSVFHGDAFCLLPAPGNPGATVLFLNPPYDRDPEFHRLEHRFLARFTNHLAPGNGFLLFLVPHRSLEASAEHLPAHYTDLRAWRLPPGHFERFGQVLVAGRRRSRPVPPTEHSVARIHSWAERPMDLPHLPHQCPEPYVVPNASMADYYLSYTLAPTDFTRISEAFDPWPTPEAGGRLAVDDLLGARFPVALPPRPAHIALALASGMFNGRRLEPDRPGQLPPLLAKGTYTRESVEIDRSEQPDGSTSITAIDRPRLQVTVLDLDTSAFHTLADGTEPAGGLDLSRWTAADLLLHYGQSMADLLHHQFPALHDPACPGDQIELPKLARTPYPIQHHAVQAALKLLATGRNPFLVAEVGTGKTTMALTLAAALAPDHHADTVLQLRALRLPMTPPIVRRTLVLCPPHLLGSWRDQAAAVVPHARVQIVDSPEDLEVDADLFVLSRERAKLGYGHAGVSGLCPRCASPLTTSGPANASRRIRCSAQPRRPQNLAAHLALHLAALLAPHRPTDDLVASLAPPRLVEHARRRGPVPLSTALLERFRDTLLHQLVLTLRDRRPSKPPTGFYLLARLLKTLTRALQDPLPELAQRLEQIASSLDDPSSISLLRTEISRLAHHHETTSSPEDLLLCALETLHDEAHWHTAPRCDEPLFQAAPPRRVPLARVILWRHRRRFDLVVLDEAHEFNNRRSAQAKAAHRLTGLPGAPTLVLTGSLMGGYASSLFSNFHALSPAFRAEFGRDELTQFVARYGYQKVRMTERGPKASAERGRHSDREITSRRIVDEAPGIHPLFLMRHLLPTAVPVHKSDLERSLPPLSETPAPLVPDPTDPHDQDLLAEYHRLQGSLLKRIRRDRFDPERGGRLLGALVELPSYLDRATADLDPFVLAYPDSLGGQRIATGQSFPSSWRSPKERWLLDQVERRIAAGERVLLFLRHTRTGLPHRLLALLRPLAPTAVLLDAQKVPTARREAWIDRHVNDADVPVLLVNPNAVRTGLNNLVGFSVAIWYELDTSAFTYRQAIGRLHRIGQTRPVDVLIPHYSGTAQEIAFNLVARKVTASLQVDGLDVRAALEAAGAGDGLPDGLDAALSLGRAVYRALTRSVE